MDQFLKKTSNIVLVYVLPILCITSFVLSLLSFIFYFFLQAFQMKNFFYLMVKSLLELLLFAFRTLTPYLSCLYCETETTYHRQWMKLMLFIYLKPILYLLITILEIIITQNRLMAVKSINKKQKQIKETKFL